MRLLRLFGLYDKDSLAIRLQTVLVTEDGTICQRVAAWLLRSSHAAVS
jgi:hypothetical protein